MTERAAVSVAPAIAPKKYPGAQAGEPVPVILHVRYSDGSEQFRCIVCNKEFDTFGSCWAHKTHHTRDPLSYQHQRFGSIASKRGQATLQGAIEAILIKAIPDIANNIAEAIAGDTTPQLAALIEQNADLRERLDEERKARQKIERDLSKIRKLFASD